ncbi:MAG: VOC family protein [Chloroflexi bacterium]|nr:VOC family protein [Chloroflexota bacterium]
MIRKVSVITIWVQDQEQAKDFYVNKLGFKVHTDDATTIPNYRWLTVAPPEQKELQIVLGMTMEDSQRAQIGKQGTWVLDSDNIHEDYELLKSRGVKVHGEPRQNPWGTDFVFEDLYGNTFDVVQQPQR